VNVIATLPTLYTTRLTLRKLAMSDVDDFFEYSSDPDVTRYTLWETHRSLQQAQTHLAEYVRDYDYGCMPTWGIVFTETQKLIGTCGFHHISAYAQQAEIGYTLSKAYWGQGLATEAIRTVLDFAFKKALLQRVTARITPDDIASARVLQKLGFRLSGSMLEYVPMWQQMQHLDIYQLDYF